MVLAMTETHSAARPVLASLRKLGGAFAAALFPPRCLACAAEAGSAGALCLACWDSVRFIDDGACRRCGIPLDDPYGLATECAACMARPPAYAVARSVFRYDSARDLLLRFKHADRTDYAPAFAAWMERAGAPLCDAAEVIVPVPLHRWRLLKRRYNQAALLALALGRRTRLPVLTNAILRTRPTPSQGAMVSANARRRNVLGAFVVPPRAKAKLEGRIVLLVDDVMTTGATLEACARVLTRAGAASVLALTLARVERPDEAR